MVAGGKFSRCGGGGGGGGGGGAISNNFSIHPQDFSQYNKRSVERWCILNKDNCFSKFKIEDDSHKTLFSARLFQEKFKHFV